MGRLRQQSPGPVLRAHSRGPRPPRAGANPTDVVCGNHHGSSRLSATHAMTRDDDSRRREIDEEVDGHLQARIDYLMARGASLDDARAEARRRFGDIVQGRRALYAQAALTRKRGDLVERWRQWGNDIRYVARGLS